MHPAKETLSRSHICSPLIHNQKVLSIMLPECCWQGVAVFAWTDAPIIKVERWIMKFISKTPLNFSQK